MSTYTDQITFGDADLITNPEPRCPVLLLLDRSGSMTGRPIAQLNDGLLAFQRHLAADALAMKRVELAIVSFGGAVDFIRDFKTIDDWTPQNLTAGGDTPMGRAIREGIDRLRQRKAHLKTHGISYYRPWVLLITDGAPTDDWHDIPKLVESEIEKKAMLFYPVGVENADMQILKQISPATTPLKLQGLEFSRMFVWLSSSLQRVSTSSPGEKITLDDPTGPAGWGTVEI
jgi:uncharacterized protein YegL